MLPFNVALFKQEYASLVTNWSNEQLTNIWYDEALVIGSKILATLNNNTPINLATNSINSWNASINVPTLSNDDPQLDTSYLCIVEGDVNFGAGIINFSVYDIVSFNSLLMQWTNIGKPYDYYWAGIVLAHLISLYNRPTVGRLNNATEGDVSGQFDFQSTQNSKWWEQTTYGARVWQMIKRRGGFTAFPCNPYQGFAYQGNNNVYN